MNEPRVVILPAPEGIRRVETGAVQFGDDWPGLFIRGDNAVALMLSIRAIEKRVTNADHNLNHLSHIADIVDRDVVVKRRSIQPSDQP